MGKGSDYPRPFDFIRQNLKAAFAAGINISDFYQLTPYLTNLAVEAKIGIQKNNDQMQKYLAYVSARMVVTGWVPDFHDFVGVPRTELSGEHLEKRMTVAMRAHNNAVKGSTHA